MNIVKTELKGLLIIEPRVFEDERGYFYESYNKSRFHEIGVSTEFVQDNQSKSVRGVVRGLHYQLNPQSQAKLVRVLEGVIYDVAVDIREGSPSFGKWVGIELSAENKKQLLVPKGFAHGFSTISETAVVFYKCDDYYSPEHERGISLKDPDLAIDWKIPEMEMIISGKDKAAPLFQNAEYNFNFG